MKIKSIVAVVLLILISSFSISVCAVEPQGDSGNIPYTSYNYVVDEDTVPRETKAIYDIENVLTANEIGIVPFGELNDVCTDRNNNIYLLDGKTSRIIIIDSSYNLVKIISSLHSEKGEVNFIGAKGIFVYSNGDIYIADTQSSRVLICDTSDNLKDIISLPDSTLIPEDFNYKPIRVTVDSSGYVYVLSDGSYYGAILYSPDGKFLGFYGANSVSQSITQTLYKLWKKLTSTNAKKASSGSSLPYQFTDLYVDNKNFIYTATGKTSDATQKGQIKQLSPGGQNILNSENIVFGDNKIGTINSVVMTQDIAGIAVDSSDFFYCYDVSYGRIYMYDKESYLISAFGGGIGAGNQKGTFSQIAAIDILEDGNKLVVIDSLKYTVTVFSMTDFGKKIKEARKLTLNGSYNESKSIWQDILSEDAGCQLAYIGLAKTAILNKDYSTAIKYAQKGYDKEIYSQAFTYLRKIFIKKNFNIIMSLTVITVGIIVFVVIYCKKKKIVFLRNRKVKETFSSVFHPALVFDDVKSKKGGSVFIGIIITLIFYISAILKSTVSGYLFTSTMNTSFNSLIVLMRTAGFVVLFTLVNWAIATLLGGIGKLREIFIVITYSIQPFIVGNLCYTVLSHFLNASEGQFLEIFIIAMEAYGVFMAVIGLIKIHDVSFGSFLGITLLTFLGMLIIIFILTLIIVLAQQTFGFVGTITNELVFR